jgi:hypothetical protein
MWTSDDRGVNALRGHLSEFGIIAAKGIGRVDELLDLVESTFLALRTI